MGPKPPKQGIIHWPAPRARRCREEQRADLERENAARAAERTRAEAVMQRGWM